MTPAPGSSSKRWVTAAWVLAGLGLVVALALAKVGGDRGIWGDEDTYVAMAASLARDGDNADYSPATLANPNGYNGTEGLFRFLPGGIAERGYAIMEITEGGTQTLLAAPASFAPAIN